MTREDNFKVNIDVQRTMHNADRLFPLLEDISVKIYDVSRVALRDQRLLVEQTDIELHRSHITNEASASLLTPHSSELGV